MSLFNVEGISLVLRSSSTDRVNRDALSTVSLSFSFVSLIFSDFNGVYAHCTQRGSVGCKILITQSNS